MELFSENSEHSENSRAERSRRYRALDHISDPMLYKAIFAGLLLGTDALRLGEVIDRRAALRIAAAAPLAALAQAASAERPTGTTALGGRWMDSASSNIVLGSGNGDSKEAATLALNPKTGKGTQDGKRVDDAGATYYAKSLTGSPGSASALNGRKGGNIPSIRLAGKWSDPMHPGCTRKIQLSAGKAFIAGSDEDGKPVRCPRSCACAAPDRLSLTPTDSSMRVAFLYVMQWKVVGTVTGNDIIIDFSPKGGPKDVKATFVIGKGITFPDGNVWSRIS